MSIGIIVNIILLLLGLAGFALSLYIYARKIAQKPVICPLRSNCHKVIGSTYAEILGIPVEVLGMGYYGFVVISHIGLLLVPGVVDPFVIGVGILLSFGAFCFSIYLICVQVYLIKEMCTWCIASAILTLIIFVITIFFVPKEVSDFLLASKSAITVFHLVSAAIGLGAATVADIFFFKFLKDSKISFFESDVLQTFSIIVWFALFAMIFSGIGLYIPQHELLYQSPSFLIKMIGLGVLVINGLFLNFIVAPKLTRAFFHMYTKFQRFAYACSAISIVSWYFIFIVGSLLNPPVSFLILLAIYIILLFIAIIGSQLFLYSISQKL